MTLRLNGNTSGYTEIDAPAVAGSNTLLLPASNGSAYQFLRNGATAGTTEFAAAITSGTVVASTSGTSIDFTSIPSYVKRITVMFNGVSTNGSSYIRIQIGSGSIDATGYTSTNGTIGSASVSGATGASGGWELISSASSTIAGTCTILLLGSNTWVFNSLTSIIVSTNTNITAGTKSALSGTLNRVRITTVNGTDTFDAGSINILYEG